MQNEVGQGTDVEWTVEAILGRLRELPRCPSVSEADLTAHAEHIYFAGRRPDSEKPKAAAEALSKARNALVALGPTARYALRGTMLELRPDPWHHPVDGYMPVPPSPWDPRYQRPLDVDLLLDAIARAEAAQRGHITPGSPEKIAAGALARALVRAWYCITGAWPPADPYQNPDAAHPFHQLASDLFALAGRRDSWQSQIRVAVRNLKHDNKVDPIGTH
jgi:hypothetical protein